MNKNFIDLYQIENIYSIHMYFWQVNNNKNLKIELLFCKKYQTTRFEIRRPHKAIFKI